MKLDKEKISKLYFEEGKTLAEIGKRAGVTEQRISKRKRTKGGLK